MDFQSCEKPSRNAYGDIQIDGNAHVLLGDQNVSNLYQYNVGTVSLYAKPKKRLASRAILRPSNLPRTTKTGLRARRVLGQAKIRFEEQEDARTTYKVLGTTASISPVGPLGSTQYEQVRQLLAFLYELLRDFPYLPSIPMIVIPPQREEKLPVLAPQNAEADELIKNTSWSISSAGRDLLVLSAASLSLLLGRNLSAQDVLRLLSDCQQDQLMPLLTFLLGFGLYRYLALSTLTAAPATQYFLTLEDAYGHSRPIAMDVCLDFGVLRQFLQAHYRQTSGPAGEALVKAGQFHLLLGSRRGRLIQAEEWSTPGSIRKGSRIVNSVFVSVNDTKCPACSTMFTVTKNGEFHCEPCQTYHRDYDTFSTEVSPRAPQVDAVVDRPPPRASYPTMSSTESTAEAFEMSDAGVKAGNAAIGEDEDRTNSVYHTTVGLKNVDIRIVGDRRLPSGDLIPLPLRWVQPLFKTFTWAFNVSRISCYDLPDLSLAKKDDVRHEILRLSFQDGFVLSYDYRSPRSQLSLRLTHIVGDVILESSQPLSRLDIVQTDLSLRISQIDPSGTAVSWIMIELPSRVNLVLFYNTFITLRSQDTSSNVPSRIMTDPLFEEITEFVGVIFNGEARHVLFVYHDRLVHKVRLEAAPLGGSAGWLPSWTAFIDLTVVIRRWCRRINEMEVNFHLNAFWGHTIYSFSSTYKPSLVNDDTLILKFDSQKHADDFFGVMNEITPSDYSHETAYRV